MGIIQEGEHEIEGGRNIFWKEKKQSTRQTQQKVLNWKISQLFI